MRALLVVAGLYGIAFFWFYPDFVSIDDEAMYLRQAQVIARGATAVPKLDAFTDEVRSFNPSPYPLGTAGLMAPFVAVGGWRGAFMVPFLALMGSVFILAYWLRDEGRSPLFALLLLGYPPSFVMGRIAMSDVPSTFVVVAGLWLFFRGIGRPPWLWISSGFLAGSSLLFRDTNPMVFVPFFVGAVVRRDPHWWALLVGGLAGTSLRLGANWLVLGDPFHQRAPMVFALDSVMERLPVYLIAILLFVPGGFVFSMLYKGRRRPELCASLVLFVSAYVIQLYYPLGSPFGKLLVLVPRYMLPIVPVMVFGMAEAVPRLWSALVEERNAWTSRLEKARRIVFLLWVGGIGTAAIAVNAIMDRWGEGHYTIADTIRRAVDPSQVLVTNLDATGKFIDTLERRYVPVDSAKLTPVEAKELLEHHGQFIVCFLDRSDSEYWRAYQEENARFIEALAPSLLPTVDLQVTSTYRLRIWQLGARQRS